MVIPEAELERLLGGMHGELYTTLFALDHPRLREAGEQLVRGGEDLGESLFGAGMGRDVHRLLARLRENAGRLFLPRGKKPLLNGAISAFKKAQTEANKSHLQPASWHKAQDTEARLRHQRNDIESELSALEPQKERLLRLGRVLPLLRSYDELLRQRSELGEAPLLPAAAGKERLEVMGRLRNSEASLELLQEKISGLEEQLQQQGSQQDLLIHAQQIKALFKRLGAQLEAGEARIRLSARIDGARNEAPSALRGQEGRAELDAGRQNRLRKMISQHPLLIDERDKSQRATALAESKLQRIQEQLAELGAVEQPVSLCNAVEAVKSADDLPRQSLESQSALTRARASAESQLARLGHWTGALAEAYRLACPDKETVSRFAERWLKLEGDSDQLKGLESKRLLDQDKIKDELAALELQGPCPAKTTCATLALGVTRASVSFCGLGSMGRRSTTKWPPTWRPPRPPKRVIASLVSVWARASKLPTWPLICCAARRSRQPTSPDSRESSDLCEKIRLNTMSNGPS